MKYILKRDGDSLIFRPLLVVEESKQIIEIVRSKRIIKNHVIHCSATKEGHDIDIKDVRKWHMDRGWRDVGYHFFVKLDGTIQYGRHVNDIGAHVRGYNKSSIGTCYAGGLDDNMEPKDTRTKAQKQSLLFIDTKLKELHRNLRTVGHRDMPRVAKACPCFDAIPEYKF